MIPVEGEQGGIALQRGSSSHTGVSESVCMPATPLVSMGADRRDFAVSSGVVADQLPQFSGDAALVAVTVERVPATHPRLGCRRDSDPGMDHLSLRGDVPCRASASSSTPLRGRRASRQCPARPITPAPTMTHSTLSMLVAIRRIAASQAVSAAGFIFLKHLLPNPWFVSQPRRGDRISGINHVRIAIFEPHFWVARVGARSDP
jgi:hypothetical protein